MAHKKDAKTRPGARAPATEVPPVSAYKSKSGLRRILNATGYSLLGLRAAWQHEAAFRQEVVAGVLLLAGGLWLAPSLLYGVLMAASILLVWCVELINSAIEALADAITTDTHPLLGRAKDIGSAAVMMSLLVVGLVWGSALVMVLRGG